MYHVLSSAKKQILNRVVVSRRFVPSAALVVMDDDRHDVEVAILGPYQEKSKASKAFPSLKNKPPWVRHHLHIVVFLFYLELCQGS